MLPNERKQRIFLVESGKTFEGEKFLWKFSQKLCARKMKTFLISTFFLQLFLQQIIAASLSKASSSKHENLVSKLSNYRLVRPYRSTPDGEFLSFDLSASGEEVVNRRRRRSADNADEVDFSTNYHFVVDSVDGDELLLNVDKMTDLFAPNFVIEKFTEEGDIVTETPSTDCFYQGQVGNVKESTVAISSCVGLSGVISVGNEEYVIEPVDPDEPFSVTNKTYGGTHIIYRTTDHEDHENVEDLFKTIDLTNDEEFLGYTDDSDLRVKRASRLLPTDQVHYVKTMLVADASLQEFHGTATTMYMATMMNLVNKIYAHHSLGLNIKIVITRIELLNNRKSRNIISSDPQQSLRNANDWAVSQNTVDEDDPDHFDSSLFLTKSNFGASGYANVGEMCRPSLSAALVLDRQGLRTSFVAAHEIAHLLGVEHDNEDRACRDDADSSAVMAAFVTSNFHNYYWSTCSRAQIYRKLRSGNLDCLEDPPAMSNEEATYPGVYSTLDEQCRFNYGPTATACPREDLDPCETLYCQTDADDVPCKSISRTTRPMEGTPCGENKWCIQGVCRLRQNSQATDNIYEWHAGDWSPCSLTCGGVGVKSRTVTCREVQYDKSGRLAVVSDPVGNNLCHPDLKPAKKTECLSRACSADWVTGPWSECSVTCGSGKRTRSVTCDTPQNTDLEYRCLSSKPEKSKNCQMEECPDTGVCKPAAGAVCKAKFYQRFCRMPGYQQQCCYTCEEQEARIASWKGKRNKD